LNISNLGKSVIPTTHPEKFVKVTKESQRTVEGKIVHIVGKIQVRDFKNNPSADPDFIGADGQKIKSPFCIIGSRNLLEISIRNGDAAKKLKVKAGSPVKLVSYEKK